MSTESDEESRAELIARAGELRRSRGLSTRQIAAEMGIPHSTARGYIKLAEQHTEWIDLFERAEMSEALGQQGMKIMGRLSRAIDAADDEALVKLAPVWFRGAGQLAQLFGLNAPTRVQTEDVTPSRQARPDPEIAAAVRAARLAAARERAELRGETIDEDEDET